MVSARVSTRLRVTEIWGYRELLVLLTRKELRVRYKDSFLGFIWSLISPATTLLVYLVVFQVILHNGIPQYAIYLMSGILVWNFFSSALSSATGSVVANAGIIKKVAFPREIVALSTIGASLVHFFLQCIVMAVFMLIFRHGPAVAYLPILIPAMIALVLFTSALGVLLAAINVRMRDTSHLVDVALQVWFWASGILVQYERIRTSVFNVLEPHHLKWFVYQILWYLYRLNPVGPIVLSFQRALYARPSPLGPSVGGKPGAPIAILPRVAGQWWYVRQDLEVIAFSLLLLWFALRTFARVEGSFAEDL